MQVVKFPECIYLGDFHSSIYGYIPAYLPAMQGGFCLYYQTGEEIQAHRLIEDTVLFLLESMPIDLLHVCIFDFANRPNFPFLAQLKQQGIYHIFLNENACINSFDLLEQIMRMRYHELFNESDQHIDDYNARACTPERYYVLIINTAYFPEDNISEHRLKNFIKDAYNAGFYIIALHNKDQVIYNHQHNLQILLSMLPSLIMEQQFTWFAVDEKILPMQKMSQFDFSFLPIEINQFAIIQKIHAFFTTKNESSHHIDDENIHEAEYATENDDIATDAINENQANIVYESAENSIDGENLVTEAVDDNVTDEGAINESNVNDVIHEPTENIINDEIANDVTDAVQESFDDKNVHESEYAIENDDIATDAIDENQANIVYESTEDSINGENLVTDAIDDNVTDEGAINESNVNDVIHEPTENIMNNEIANDATDAVQESFDDENIHEAEYATENDDIATDAINENQANIVYESTEDSINGENLVTEAVDDNVTDEGAINESNINDVIHEPTENIMNNEIANDATDAVQESFDDKNVHEAEYAIENDDIATDAIDENQANIVYESTEDSINGENLVTEAVDDNVTDEGAINESNINDVIHEPTENIMNNEIANDATDAVQENIDDEDIHEAECATENDDIATDAIDENQENIVHKSTEDSINAENLVTEAIDDNVATDAIDDNVIDEGAINESNINDVIHEPTENIMNNEIANDATDAVQENIDDENIHEAECAIENDDIATDAIDDNVTDENQNKNISEHVVDNKPKNLEKTNDGSDDDIISKKDFLRIKIGTLSNGEDAYLSLGALSQNYCIMLFAVSVSNKSDFINNVIMQIGMTYDASQIRLYLMDFLGGSFGQFKKHPNVAKIFVGVDIWQQTSMLFEDLQSKIEERQQLFERIQAQDIEAYNAQNADNPLPYIGIVIDEFHRLFIGDLLHRRQINRLLGNIILQWRKFGVFLLLSASTLKGVNLDAKLKEQIGMSISYRVNSSSVLDCSIFNETSVAKILSLRPHEVLIQTCLDDAYTAFVDKIQANDVVDSITGLRIMRPEHLQVQTQIIDCQKMDAKQAQAMLSLVDLQAEEVLSSDDDMAIGGDNQDAKEEDDQSLQDLFKQIEQLQDISFDDLPPLT